VRSFLILRCLLLVKDLVFSLLVQPDWIGVPADKFIHIEAIDSRRAADTDLLSIYENGHEIFLPLFLGGALGGGKFLLRLGHGKSLVFMTVISISTVNNSLQSQKRKIRNRMMESLNDCGESHPPCSRSGYTLASSRRFEESTSSLPGLPNGFGHRSRPSCDQLGYLTGGQKRPDHFSKFF